jgi:hypothetical protein
MSNLEIVKENLGIKKVKIKLAEDKVIEINQFDTEDVAFYLEIESKISKEINCFKDMIILFSNFLRKNIKDLTKQEADTFALNNIDKLSENLEKLMPSSIVNLSKTVKK